MTPHEIAERIDASWKSWISTSSYAPAPHPHVWASAWRACDRRMVYECTIPDQLPPWPAEVRAKFLYGHDRERDQLVNLARIGRDATPPFTVIGQQERFELKDRRGRVVITGKVDARLEIDRERPPVEIKAWSPYVVERLETFRDVFDNPWTRSGGYQMLSYLYGASEPYGFLLLDRSGIPRLLPVELDRHLDEMEAFLTRAEHVRDHVDAGTLPDYYDDPIECQRCPWYGAVCNPPEAFAGATVLTDPELEARLIRREELKAAAREYSDLDADVKAALRGVEHGIVGSFEIKGRWGKQSRIEVPDDLKKQYTRVDPRGRFTLEITKL